MDAMPNSGRLPRRGEFRERHTQFKPPYTSASTAARNQLAHHDAHADSPIALIGCSTGCALHSLEQLS